MDLFCLMAYYPLIIPSFASIHLYELMPMQGQILIVSLVDIPQKLFLLQSILLLYYFHIVHENVVDYGHSNT